MILLINGSRSIVGGGGVNVNAYHIPHIYKYPFQMNRRPNVKGKALNPQKITQENVFLILGQARIFFKGT